MEIIRILISFSLGKTSAFMTQWILNFFDAKPIKVFGSKGVPAYIYFKRVYPNNKEIHLIVVTANTGEEDNRSLIFGNKCDKQLRFNINYVEAVVKNGRIGTEHIRLKYEQLSRNGEPFEEVIKKYGIPNHSYPHCTRELKQRPIHHFVKSIGWDNYETAIGYRWDELKRINRKTQTLNKQLYFLVDVFPVDKKFVNEFWQKMPFTLEINEEEGNCKKCWKKSLPKLLKLIHSDKTKGITDDWPERMELKYGNFTPPSRKENNAPYTFYRGNKSFSNLKKLSDEFYKESKTETEIEVADLVLLKQGDLNKNDCEESCEPF